MQDDILKMISSREGEMNSLFSRMEQDKDLYYLKEFKLRDRHKRDIPDVTNITLNDPQTFANRSMSILIGARMQPEVSFPDKEDKDDAKAAGIERWIKDYYTAADEEISLRALGDLYSFAVQQICLRGYVAARCINYTEDGRIVPDIFPMDTRYLVYEQARDGLLWAAYKTYRSKAALQKEYGYDIASGFAYVWDYWDKDKNAIYIEDTKKEEYENEWGYVPMIIEAAAGGSLLQDVDSLSHKGESIFAANRDLYTKHNEIMSMLATQSSYGFKPPMQFRTDSEEPPSEIQYGKDHIQVIGPDEQYLPMPIQDMLAATRHLLNLIETRIQRGGLPAIEYGNLTFPLSAVAISRLTATKDQVFLPRMQALALFYQKLTRMIIDQWQEKRIRAELGLQGQKTRYSYTDLQGEYSIGYRFNATSPEQNVANYTIAAAAHDAGVSSDTIRRSILQFENPSQEKQKREMEDAIKASPILTTYNRVKALIDLGYDKQAKLLAKELQVNVQRLMRGELPTEPQDKIDRPRMPIPLTTESTGSRTSQMESQDIDTAQEASIGKEV